jgi:hypothetical protein
MAPAPRLLTAFVAAALDEPVELSLHPLPQLEQPVIKLMLQHIIFSVRPNDLPHSKVGLMRYLPKIHVASGMAALAVIPTPTEKTQEAPSLLFTPHAMPAEIPTPTLMPIFIVAPTVRPKLMANPMVRETWPCKIPPMPSETDAARPSFT